MIATRCVRLWQDESGVVLSIEMILLATLVVLGLIVGMSAYRDAMVSEMADSAAAVGRLSQTFEYDEVSLSGAYGVVPYDARIDGSSFDDELDFCEALIPDPANAVAMCIVISAASIQQE